MEKVCHILVHHPVSPWQLSCFYANPGFMQVIVFLICLVFSLQAQAQEASSRQPRPPAMGKCLEIVRGFGTTLELQVNGYYVSKDRTDFIVIGSAGRMAGRPSASYGSLEAHLGTISAAQHGQGSSANFYYVYVKQHPGSRETPSYPEMLPNGRKLPKLPRWVRNTDLILVQRDGLGQKHGLVLILRGVDRSKAVIIDTADPNQTEREYALFTE